jgi:hypothetical protein
MRIGVVAALVAAAVCGAAPASAGPGAGPPPVARHVPSIPTVGPLFLPSVLGLGSALGLPHYCSAAVVHSPRHDVAITAAHCMVGAGLGIEFAPGYSGRSTPYGVWAVRRVYVDPAWVQRRDSRYDVAVLLLARHGGRGVEDVTGRAPRFGPAPEPDRSVTVDGYLAGSGGTPITCTNRVYYTRRFPSFDCGGYGDGVSGGPWLADGRLVGVTGGLKQGGCTPSTSYSAPFGPRVAALLARARAGEPGDAAPVAGPAGC